VLELGDVALVPLVSLVPLLDEVPLLLVPLEPLP